MSEVCDLDAHLPASGIGRASEQNENHHDGRSDYCDDAWTQDEDGRSLAGDGTF